MPPDDGRTPTSPGDVPLCALPKHVPIRAFVGPWSRAPSSASQPALLRSALAASPTPARKRSMVFSRLSTREYDRPIDHGGDPRG